MNFTCLSPVHQIVRLLITVIITLASVNVLLAESVTQKEIDELREQLPSHEEALKAVLKLQKIADKFYQTNIELQKKLRVKEQQLSKAENENANLVQESVKTTESMTTIRKENVELKRELQAKGQQLSEAENKNTNLTQKIEQQKTNIQTLKTESFQKMLECESALKAKQDELVNIQEEINQKQADIEDKAISVNRLEKELNSVKLRLTEANSNLLKCQGSQNNKIRCNNNAAEKYVLLLASFNCNKASTFAERTICDSERLSDADGRLSQVYRRLKRSLSETEIEQLTYEQQQWLRQRDLELEMCERRYEDYTDCGVQIYEKRISELKRFE